MRSDERRTITFHLMALLVLLALAACSGTPPSAAGATWDLGVWDAATWQP